MATRKVCLKCGALLGDGMRVSFCSKCLFLAAGGALLNPTANSNGTGDEGGPVGPEDSCWTVTTQTCSEGHFQTATPVELPASFGDYELLEEIGRGGMGVVYRARQRSLDRVVAIKMMTFGPRSSPDRIKRFQAEAVAAGSLHHPNIVPIHEVGARTDQPFFVMDYIDGQNLAKLLGNLPLPGGRAAGYLKTVAEARTFPPPGAELPADPVYASISPDGRFLACNDSCTNIFVFEARSGRLRATLVGEPPPKWLDDQELRDLEFLTRGSLLVVQTTHGGVIWDWETPTNQTVIVFPGMPLAISRDDRWIVLRDDSRKLLTLVEATAPAKTMVEMAGHADPIVSVAFSHDGQTLTSLDDRSELRLWKLPDGRPVGMVRLVGVAFENLAFARDDTALYVSGLHGVQILEAPRASHAAKPAPVARHDRGAANPESIWAPGGSKPPDGSESRRAGARASAFPGDHL